MTDRPRTVVKGRRMPSSLFVDCPLSYVNDIDNALCGCRVEPPGGAGVLKALTVRQPWANAIIWAGKTVENRSWRTSYRGRLYIHAGQRLEPDHVLPVGVPVPRGAIIGTVEVTGCHRCDGSCSAWAEADWCHWVLADPVALAEPVPCRGALGLMDAAHRAPYTGANYLSV